ncbi:MAG: hypothetical protein U5O39_08290 [Gammaproteobacteria bacterium]|nr:hypothetical protein [Gammaproteobacteria bacterium]
MFSIFSLNPAPFCLLDEVDAPLDDANVGRYSEMVKEMARSVQFIYHHAQQTRDGDGGPADGRDDARTGCLQVGLGRCGRGGCNGCRLKGVRYTG